MRQSLVIVLLSCMLASCASKPPVRSARLDSCTSPSSNPGNVGNVINSGADDYAPQFFGNTLVYSSAMILPQKYPKTLRAEIFVAKHDGPMSDPMKVNEGWSEPIALGHEPMQGFKLNLNEGSMAILPEKHLGVFAAERILRPRSDLSPLLDLYQVTLSDDFQPSGVPVPLDEVNDPDAWDSQPALTADGTTLFFVSDRAVQPDTVRGNVHIYRSDLQNGKWSKPARLPAPFTTKGNDVSPHVGGDGWFYFSSDGNPDGGPVPAGLGKRDIFRVKMVGSQLVGSPIRLSAPYNSDGDDDFPFVSKDNGWLWLASDRSGGCDKRDIYTFPIPGHVRLRANVIQSTESCDGQASKTPLRTTLLLHDVGDSSAADDSIQTDGSGIGRSMLQPDHHYSLTLQKQVCNNDPIVKSIDAQLHVRSWQDTEEYLVNFEPIRKMLCITMGKNDTIPWFITGYYKPNTPENLKEYFDRKHSDPEFRDLTVPGRYIRDTDRSYGPTRYTEASRKIDSILKFQLYDTILNVFLPQLTGECFDTNTVLVIQVNGYTDKEHITANTGRYLDEAVIPDSGESVLTGEQLCRVTDTTDSKQQWGNVRLSTLRAYWSMKTLREHLDAVSDVFRRVDQEGQHVIWQSRGRGIDYSARPDLGYNRRIDVEVRLEKRAAASNPRD